MSDEILVTYATWVGSTGEVAQTVAQTLRDEGATVTVLPTQDVSDPGSYRAVVLGSGIRMGKLHPDALDFVEKHQQALSQTPVAYFVVCLTMRDDTDENRGTVDAYLDPLRAKAPQVQALDVGLFAGALDYEKLPPPFQQALKAMNVPEGDFRQWDDIRAWSKRLLTALP